MQDSKTTDSTQKFGSPPPRPMASIKPQLVGAAMMVIFLILFVTGILPELKWLLFQRQPGGNPWIEDVLPVHIWWVAIILFLLGGIRLMVRNAKGYSITVGASLFWFGMKFFYILLMIFKGNTGLFTALASNLGLSIPPSLTSVGVLVINVLCLWSILTLNGAELKAELGVSPPQLKRGLYLGMGMIVYGVSCYLLKELLAPPPLPPVSFQF